MCGESRSDEGESAAQNRPTCGRRTGGCSWDLGGLRRWLRQTISSQDQATKPPTSSSQDQASRCAARVRSCTKVAARGRTVKVYWGRALVGLNRLVGWFCGSFCADCTGSFVYVGDVR